ncbi:hypothetical protein NYR97_11625 [Xanthomonas hydrangeae]|uniref:Beta-ketoacyl-[acyl-carrier-protein] synthase III N-terminal domain-containing protein n=1 Tax=Xanthomonas hydrangeae TaxID=2775159 RepID=A0AAU0B6X4_9XANT|nr:hypothetical protein [Xanthomonas hydrangeae]WOB47943.1 hypothetical protein NYR97_11625 [Xanthomonas hydrangeae]
MSLAIIAASTAALQPSIPTLASGRPFPHLSCVAGMASAPPSSALLRASGYEQHLRSKRCHSSLGAHVEAHARALLASLPGQAPPVQDVLHCQATLQDQILASMCLRVAYACSSEPRRAMTIDQTGTSGVATALFLGLHAGVAAPEGLLLVTAADTWSSTFPGTFLPLVAYGDAVGALLLRHADPTRPAPGERAHLLAVVCRPCIGREPFWSKGPVRVRNEICEQLAGVAEEVLSRVGWNAASLDLLLGDPIGPDIGADLVQRLGGCPQRAPQAEGDHAASVALMVNIVSAIEFAQVQDRPVKCLLWTASADGSVAAVALHAFPDAKTTP